MDNVQADTETLTDDDDPMGWAGDPKLRFAALASLTFATVPSFGIDWLQAAVLLICVLYLLPYMTYIDQVVHRARHTHVGRFITAGRVVWSLLALKGITWQQVILSSICQAAIHISITALNYALYHRTLLKFIEGSSQYILALEFSLPLNPVQLTSCELLHVLLLHRFFNIDLSFSRTLILGITSFWWDRIIAQILLYVRREDSTVGNRRVFFLHWGASADSGHWLMQVEGYLIHIFKRGGRITAEPSRPDRDKDRPEDRMIPDLAKSLYIPFFRYGIVGLVDHKTEDFLRDKWAPFIEDWITVERYSSATRSCQEFVIFAMYSLCDPPLFNMSDLKSLVPPLLVCLLLSLDIVLYAGFISGKWMISDLFI